RFRSIINLVASVGGAYGSRGGELGNGNVVGVPIGSVRPEGYDHVRPDSPDVRDNRANGDWSLDLIHGAVRIAQDGNLADAEYLGGSAQLGLANSSHFDGVPTLS